MKKYKWVDRNLGSSQAGYGIRIQYKLDEFVAAEFGGCLVFNTEEAARRFIKDPPDEYSRLFECTVKAPVPFPSIYRASTVENKEEMQRYWASDPGYLVSPFLWPTGSEAYKYVKLTKELK